MGTEKHTPVTIYKHLGNTKAPQSLLVVPIDGLILLVLQINTLYSCRLAYPYIILTVYGKGYSVVGYVRIKQGSQLLGIQIHFQNPLTGKHNKVCIIVKSHLVHYISRLFAKYGTHFVQVTEGSFSDIVHRQTAGMRTDIQFITSGTVTDAF